MYGERNITQFKENAKEENETKVINLIQNLIRHNSTEVKETYKKEK